MKTDNMITQTDFWTVVLLQLPVLVVLMCVIRCDVSFSCDSFNSSDSRLKMEIIIFMYIYLFFLLFWRRAFGCTVRTLCVPLSFSFSLSLKAIQYSTAVVHQTFDCTAISP